MTIDNEPKSLSTPKSIVYSLWSVVLIFILQGCSTVYNPATDRREFIMISTPSEVNMGKNIHQTLDQEYKFIENSPQVERLKRVGGRLARISDRQDYPYNFFLIDKDEMNAFTTPGGNIYMYSGLMDKLTTDDQIAAVLAHEIGHCSARHTVKKFQAALGYNLISAIIMNQIETDDTRKVAALSTNAIMSVVFSSYGRKDEYEADRLGLKYMHLACFRPEASIETFSILEKESEGPQGPLILRSHPYMEDRIKAADAELPLISQKYGRPACSQEHLGKFSLK